MVFFEVPGMVPDPDRARHSRMQHVAFEVQNFDELLGTYARLKGLGILPVWAADHGMATAFYYQDPDHNIVEINVNVYGSEWTATEHMKTRPLREGVRRSRQDARGPQEGRVALGIARACHRRRVRSLEAVRSPHELLKGPGPRGGVPRATPAETQAIPGLRHSGTSTNRSDCYGSQNISRRFGDRGGGNAPGGVPGTGRRPGRKRRA